MTRHYLDHASTSPLRPAARDAMVAALDLLVSAGADPGRIHAEGLAVRHALEQARQQIADGLGARSREVVLTSSATEAIATAVWGAAERGRHLVVPAVEHSAVRSAALALADAGSHEVTIVGVDAHGRVDADELLAAVRHDTALVALQWANHEVGTRQPVAQVVAACRERGVLTLVDAAQAVGRDEVRFGALGADLLAVSGHKAGGPPGVGVLCIRRSLRLRPLLRGGDQERARRAGLENLPAAVGLAAALAELDGPPPLDAAADQRGDTIDRPVTRRSWEAAEQARLTGRLLVAISDLEGVEVFGHPTDRLPHLACLGIDGVEPQGVLLGLDQAGVAAHSGSACSSEDLLPSPVLEAMGVDAHRSLRLSVGWSSNDADVDAATDALPRVLAHLRGLAAGR
jgi:cysteine desulfurase